MTFRSVSQTEEQGWAVVHYNKSFSSSQEFAADIVILPLNIQIMNNDTIIFSLHFIVLLRTKLYY